MPDLTEEERTISLQLRLLTNRLLVNLKVIDYCCEIHSSTYLVSLQDVTRSVRLNR